jgi:hypothetical protein
LFKTESIAPRSPEHDAVSATRATLATTHNGHRRITTNEV